MDKIFISYSHDSAEHSEQVALDNLSLGRAYFIRSQQEKKDNFDDSLTYLNNAVEKFLEAGREDFLPCALLARAECFQFSKDFVNAWKDLNKAKEIAELGNLKLFLCDYRIEAGKLCKAQKMEKEAEMHLKQAAEMIKEMKYYRKKGLGQDHNY